MNSSSLSPPKITVIGLGNLAWSLVPALQRVATVHQLIGRRHLASFQSAYQIPLCSDTIQDLHSETDLVFLAVGDQAIPSLTAELAKLNRRNCVYVHSSGSTSLDALSALGEQIGVFYPLQTFTKGRVKDFEEMPLFLEGNPSVLSLLRPLAEAMSQQVYMLDSGNRLRLHLGGVMCSNFTNLLYRLTDDLIQSHSQLDFTIFEPLIREQIDKVFALGPAKSQTGPAIRGDERTMQKHLDLLEDAPEMQDLYAQMSRMIRARQ